MLDEIANLRFHFHFQNMSDFFPQIRGRKPMTREPDMALLITASGSFDDEPKLAHKEKRSAHTRFQM